MTYSSQIQDNNQFYNQQLQNRDASVNANLAVDTANAAQTGQTLQQLGELSKTLSGFLKKEKEKRIKESKLKYYNQGFEEGIAPSPEFEADMQSAKEQNDRYLQIAGDHVQKGGSLDFADAILGMGEWHEYHRQQGYAASKLSTATQDLKDFITNNNLPTGNDTDIASSVALARSHFIRSNLIEMADGTPINQNITLTALEKLRTASGNLVKGYTKTNNINNSFVKQEQADFELGEGLIDSDEYFKRYRATVNAKGEPMRNPDISKRMWAHMTKLAKANQLSKTAFDKFADHSPSWAGGKTMRELKKGFVNQLANDMIEGETEFIKGQEDDLNNDYRQFEIDTLRKVDELAQQGQRLTQEQELELGNFVRSRFNRDPGDLLGKIYTAQEMDQESRVASLRKKIEMFGGIHEDELFGLTLEQRNTLRAGVISDPEAEQIKLLDGDAQTQIRGAADKITGAQGMLRPKAETSRISTAAIMDYWKIRNGLRAKGINLNEAHNDALEAVNKELEKPAADAGILGGLPTSPKGGKYTLGVGESDDDYARRSMKTRTNTAANFIARNGTKAGTMKIPGAESYRTALDNFKIGRVDTLPPEIHTIGRLVQGKTSFEIADIIHRSLNDGEPLKAPQIERDFQELPESDFKRKFRFPTRQSLHQASIEAGGGSYGEWHNTSAAVRRTAPVSEDFRTRGEQLLTYMVKDIGMSQEHAMGLLLNGIRESTLMTTNPGDSGTSDGIFQWHKGRLISAKKALGDSWEDPRAQIRYALEEQGEPGQEYLNTKFSSALEAAEWWMRRWERPADPDRDQVKHEELLREWLQSSN